MKSDEGFSNNADKQMLNQLWQENVIPFTRKNSKKPQMFQYFWGFFYLDNLKSTYKI